MDTEIYNEIRTQAGKMAFARCLPGIEFVSIYGRPFDILLYIRTDCNAKIVRDKM
jgi:hypothetical protein